MPKDRLKEPGKCSCQKKLGPSKWSLCPEFKKQKETGYPKVTSHSEPYSPPEAIEEGMLHIIMLLTLLSIKSHQHTICKNPAEDERSFFHILTLFSFSLYQFSAYSLK